VIGPLLPEVFEQMRAALADSSSLPVEASDFWQPTVAPLSAAGEGSGVRGPASDPLPAQAAAEPLAPACPAEQQTLDLFFANWDEDDLDLLAAPE
jgi:hypothetical protein